jgi:hypothetical protein
MCDVDVGIVVEDAELLTDVVVGVVVVEEMDRRDSEFSFEPSIRVPRLLRDKQIPSHGTNY